MLLLCVFAGVAPKRGKKIVTAAAAVVEYIIVFTKLFSFTVVDRGCFILCLVLSQKNILRGSRSVGSGS